MGQVQHTNESDARTRGRRLGWRTCLRKDCERRFQAGRYNQRYCQEPECLKRVASLAGRQAAAETSSGSRRAPTACRSGTAAAQTEGVPSRRAAGRPTSSEPKYRVPCRRQPARGHAAKKHPEIFCDRPGCYEPVRESPCASASYCSDDCRAAMAAIRDRERKWLRRNSPKGREERQHEYKAAKRKRCRGRVLADGARVACPGCPASHFGPRLSSKRSLAARLPQFPGGEPP